MSSDQMTRGLEMIASAAEKVDPHLGSGPSTCFTGSFESHSKRKPRGASDHNFGFRRLNSVESGGFAGTEAGSPSKVGCELIQLAAETTSVPSRSRAQEVGPVRV